MECSGPLIVLGGKHLGTIISEHSHEEEKIEESIRVQHLELPVMQNLEQSDDYVLLSHNSSFCEPDE